MSYVTSESTGPSYTFDTTLRDRITAHLSSFQCQSGGDFDLRAAAVALIVTRHPQTKEACFLITMRSNNLRRHSGQYALPGGRLDEGETAKRAALRETREELGLCLNTEDIVGQLDDMPTRSGFQITPFVLWGPPDRPLSPDPSEVAKVFHIPLRDLDSPDIPKLEPAKPGHQPVLSAPIATLGHQIYAPTAAILYQFREVALHGRTTRVAHFEQPEFAWR